MTPKSKLALALAAVEAAKGIVAQALQPLGPPGDRWCECCQRVINSRVGHATNCAIKDFLELVTKLEAAK